MAASSRNALDTSLTLLTAKLDAENLFCKYCDELAQEWFDAIEPLAKAYRLAFASQLGIPRSDRLAVNESEVTDNDFKWREWKKWTKCTGSAIHELGLADNLQQLSSSTDSLARQFAIAILTASAANDGDNLDRLFDDARRHASDLSALDGEFLGVTDELLSAWKKTNKAAFVTRLAAAAKCHGLHTEGSFAPKCFGNAQALTRRFLVEVLSRELYELSVFGVKPAPSDQFDVIATESVGTTWRCNDIADSSNSRLRPQAETAKKRSTERGEGRTKLIGALTKHHQYADGGCLNSEPIGNNELAKAAVVSTSTASAFFNDQFYGHSKYRALCRDTGGLVRALKLLNNEFAPYELYGRRPPGEDDRDDDE